MTGHQRKKYPKQWEELALACKQRDNWTCQHCKVKQLEQKMSRKGNPYFIYLHAAHVHQADTRNPQAELITLCISCHSRYDYEHKVKEKLIQLERLKHQMLLAAKRQDWYHYGG